LAYKVLLSSFHAAYNQRRYVINAAYNQWQFTIKGTLHFLFLYSVKLDIDDAWSFLGYILSIKLSFCISLSSASRAHSSQKIMTNRKQLLWCGKHQ